MKCNPVILNSKDNIGHPLERIESKAGDEKDEAWLQDLIYTRPELLPVTEFDDTSTVEVS